MPISIVLPIAIIIAAVVVCIVVLFPRFGPHYTSRLTCPKCNQTFDYRWVPGGSLTAVRLGPTRYMRCPICHKWSDFDIVSTRVQGPDKDSTTNPVKEW